MQYDVPSVEPWMLQKGTGTQRRDRLADVLELVIWGATLLIVAAAACQVAVELAGRGI